jgi:hypothetical protein
MARRLAHGFGYTVARTGSILRPHGAGLDERWDFPQSLGACLYSTEYDPERLFGCRRFAASQTGVDWAIRQVTSNLEYLARLIDKRGCHSLHRVHSCAR